MERSQLRQILQATRTIATVGLSSNPGKDSHAIAEYLMQQGYRVIPVNPTAKEILGQKAYPDLLSLPEPVDVVQVFRPPEDVPEIVQQAMRIGARVVWMQTGIAHPEAAAAARAAGLQVVEDACMRVAHRLLLGSRPGAR